jgi:CheY-like chemotaxis protein
MAKILIADDSAVSRVLMRGLLASVGHVVTLVEDGQEAVETLGIQKFDLVILDVEMPRMDGYEVLKTLRRTGIGGPAKLFMLTGKNRESDMVAAYRNGAHHHLTKPFEHADLIEQVDRLLLMSLEDAAAHRESELERAMLLARLEAAFV